MSNGILLFLFYLLRTTKQISNIVECECRYTFTNILLKNPMAAVYKYKFQWTKFTTYNLKLPPDNITDIDKVMYVVTSNLSVIKLNIQKCFNVTFLLQIPKKKSLVESDLQKVFMGSHLSKKEKTFFTKIMLLRNFTKCHLTWFVKEHKSTLKLSRRVDCRSLAWLSTSFKSLHLSMFIAVLVKGKENTLYSKKTTSLDNNDNL